MFREFDFHRLGVNLTNPNPEPCSVDFEALWRDAAELANLRARETFELSRLGAIEPPDCGDNSCLFAKQKGGMRTTGGCRCLRNNPRDVERYARHLRVLAEANALLIQSLETEIKVLRGGIGWARTQEREQDVRNCLASAWQEANGVMRARGQEPPP